MSKKYKEEQKLDKNRPDFVAFTGAALHANRVVVSMVESGIRLSFLEDYGVAPQFRAAVVIPIEQGIGLQKLLHKMISDLGIQLGHLEVEMDFSNRNV